MLVAEAGRAMSTEERISYADVQQEIFASILHMVHTGVITDDQGQVFLGDIADRIRRLR